jgi:hypothetical protein
MWANQLAATNSSMTTLFQNPIKGADSLTRGRHFTMKRYLPFCEIVLGTVLLVTACTLSNPSGSEPFGKRFCLGSTCARAGTRSREDQTKLHIDLKSLLYPV